MRYLLPFLLAACAPVTHKTHYTARYEATVDDLMSIAIAETRARDLDVVAVDAGKHTFLALTDHQVLGVSIAGDAELRCGRHRSCATLRHMTVLVEPVGYEGHVPDSASTRAEELLAGIRYRAIKNER